MTSLQSKVLRIILENAVVSGLVFVAMLFFVPWYEYMAFGAVVAVVLGIKQVKKFSPFWYPVIAMWDAVLWPGAMITSVRRSFLSNE